MGIEITGWGKCTPPSILTNHDLETILDTELVLVKTLKTLMQ